MKISIGVHLMHEFMPPKQFLVWSQQIFNQMHADTSFRNGSGVSTKWRETFENMSFGPKVVDWACLLKKQETGLEA